MLSCLLILGTKRCMLCCLLIFGGPKYKNLVKGFSNIIRFVNMQRTAHRHPQVCWNPYPLFTDSLDHGQWNLSLGYLYVQMVVMPFPPVSIV